MSSDTNPLEKDSKLKSLLNDVEAVDSAEGFFQWRTSFLEVYTTYLDTAGSEKAKARYEDFAKTSTGLRKIVKQLEDLLEQGNLAVGSVSVKARMSMSELKVKLGVLIKDIMKLMPATDKEIKECGFTKWHMGAVLVEDGFRIYAGEFRQFTCRLGWVFFFLDSESAFTHIFNPFIRLSHDECPCPAQAVACSCSRRCR